MKEEEKIIYTETEAAQLLGLSKKTLQMRRYKCLPPSYHRLGRSIRYKKADLLNWFESGKKEINE